MILSQTSTSIYIVFCINHHQWSKDLQTSIKFLEDLFSLNLVSIMIYSFRFRFVKFLNDLALAYPIGTASMPALSDRDSFILRQFRHSLWLTMPLLVLLMFCRVGIAFLHIHQQKIP